MRVSAVRLVAPEFLVVKLSLGVRRMERGRLEHMICSQAQLAIFHFIEVNSFPLSFHVLHNVHITIGLK